MHAFCHPNQELSQERHTFTLLDAIKISFLSLFTYHNPVFFLASDSQIKFSFNPKDPERAFYRA